MSIPVQLLAMVNASWVQSKIISYHYFAMACCNHYGPYTFNKMHAPQKLHAMASPSLRFAFAILLRAFFKTNCVKLLHRLRESILSICILTIGAYVIDNKLVIGHFPYYLYNRSNTPVET